ncbi:MULTISPECIES: mannosyl-3-phosphoglycerate phosphatase-related protein [unclassified Rahnella]|jgi:HAD-superfamily hydrolase, subfamily IIB/mannosyl-3-phosphoglycerate phosphatase family|uniref:mannosyl-3-phosphoglycerate phosphatase-related protein n=1 Tax=Rahnella TaxID=34037 RepID=UPI000E653729|nr:MULTISPECIES: mannosyl-3-phosphoglycerate phosphatase-related protein [unclassified Rahnella]AYA07160.1 mannosyl-3-phosphoglycerate phosphatase-related protein [Rahnella aquatilis]AZP51094.1 mannosyl-3-phosphoglycerate phosphatase-related protein [Rahnella aquatilis]MQB53177.1 mannosyl-3-phosphoglycerate phosphatase-related protein [Rahnella sp. RcJ3]QBJ07638.1 mannosyl-3-phosphoglycerate phosphatase-related protein [Rahnella aquatilis]
MPYLDDPLIIFTDLDGSLLDHHDYSWQPAQPWLDKLSVAQVPLILTTSKTSAEVAELQADLNLTQQPFIAENGAIIHLPPDWRDEDAAPFHLSGASYREIRQVLVELRQRYDFEFRGFGDVTAKQVAVWTGLAVKDAALAMQRDASEPLIWFGNDLDFAHLKKCLTREGLSLTRGGRFWHVMGAGAGKGQAVQWLTARYQQKRGHPVLSIGLGDGPNDLSMLEAVNYAVVIKGHHEHEMPLQRDDVTQVFRTDEFGPRGWSQGLNHFITLL